MMTPDNRRFNRVFKDVGRIWVTSGVPFPERRGDANDREFRYRDGLLTKLKRNGQLEVLRAVQRGEISIEQIIEADREGRLAGAHLMDTLRLRRPLWASIDAVLPAMGRSIQTRRRYHTSLAKLQRRATKWLGPKATIQDLERVPWRTLRDDWVVERSVVRTVNGTKVRVREETDRASSPADWNQLGRALSTFLTHATGDVYHPFRRTVMKAFNATREQEVPRRPRVRGLFWEIIARVPEHARPCYIVLGATGMRTGEYLACTEASLVAEEHAIDPSRGKTGAKRYHIDPELWPWAVAGIPSPLGYNWMRKYFKRAVAALERPELRLHDLRHLFAQTAKAEGVATADTQAALGQRTPGITRDYEMEDVKGEVARKVGAGLRALKQDLKGRAEA